MNRAGEDAIKKLKDILEEATETDNSVCYVTSDDADTLKAAIKELEQKTKWIPVSERLPNFAGTYLVTRYFPNNVMNPTYLVDACFFDGTDTWHNDNRINHERKYLTNVVAWLEEPEPYKAEGNEE